jgi:hypothetical protein
MSFGLQPSQASINNQAGQIVLNARNALQAIIYFNLDLQDLGQDGLVALGFSADDAAAGLTMFENLAAVADMCNGGEYAGPALPFNFLESTASAWGFN